MHLVELTEDDSMWISRQQGVQQALKRLHDSLKHMNKRSEKHHPWHLSLELRVNSEPFRQYVLNDLEVWGLSDTAQYFAFRRQSEADGEASYFIAETAAETSEQGLARTRKPQDRVSAWHLDQAQAPVAVDAVDDYEQWGSVWTPSRKSDVHWLYRAKDQGAFPTKTLATYLEDPNTRSKMSPYAKAQLATLIVTSFMHTSLIRLGCEKVTMNSFQYYEATKEAAPWNDNDPLILRPFLAFGFGRKLPSRIGMPSNVTQHQSEYVIGLGLLLFQIGICEYINPLQGPNSSRDARKKAIHELHKLDSRVCARYAEIVDKCLLYSNSAVDGIVSSENRFVEHVATELRQVEYLLSQI